MSASASGRINRAFFKIWDAARLRLAVLRIMFTSFAISLKNFRRPRFSKFSKKTRRICKDTEFKSSGLSLAGWLRSFQRKPVAFRSGETVHSQPGGASQERNISGEVFEDFEKISCAL